MQLEYLRDVTQIDFGNYNRMKSLTLADRMMWVQYLVDGTYVRPPKGMPLERGQDEHVCVPCDEKIFRYQLNNMWKAVTDADVFYRCLAMNIATGNLSPSDRQLLTKYVYKDKTSGTIQTYGIHRQELHVSFELLLSISVVTT